MRRRALALLLLLPLLAALAYAGVRLASLWPQRREARLVTAGSGACEQLILGDSGAARWPLVAAPGWVVARMGLSGATSATLVASLADSISARRPALVIISAGGNDAAAMAFLPPPLHARAAATAARNIAALARAGRAAGAQVRVLKLVPPGPQPWWRAALVGERQARAMAAIMAATRLPPGADWLDVPAALAGPDGRRVASLMADHVHLAPAGYARLEPALAQARAMACS